MADIRNFFTPKTHPAQKKTSSSSSSSTNLSSNKPKGSKETPAEKQSTHNSGLLKAQKRLPSSDDETVKKKQKKRAVVIESDSDEEPLPQNLRKKEKSSSSSSLNNNNGVQIKTKEPLKESKSSSSSSAFKKTEVPAKKKEELIPTSATDFFGSEPVKNSATDVKKSMKRKKSEDRIDTSIVIDDNSTEFTDAIGNMNSSSANPPSKKVKVASPVKESSHTSSSSSGSLASKLAAKVSQSNNAKEPSSKSDSHKHRESPSKSKEFTKPMESPSKTKEFTKPKESPSKTKEFTKPKDSPSPKHKEHSSKHSEGSGKSSSKHHEGKSPAKKKEKEGKQHKGEKPIVKSEDTATPVKPPKKTTSATPAASAQSDEPIPPTPEVKKKSFWAYKNREGPAALGSKEVPTGAENCLDGLAFVLTGVLESFQREEIEDCVKRHGGKVTGQVSGKTSYVILGREPGQSKLDRIAKHNTKTLDEDAFIELVTSKPAKTVNYDAESPKSKPSKAKKTPVQQQPSTPISSKPSSSSIKQQTPPLSFSDIKKLAEQNTKQEEQQERASNASPGKKLPSWMSGMKKEQPVSVKKEPTTSPVKKPTPSTTNIKPSPSATTNIKPSPSTQSNVSVKTHIKQEKQSSALGRVKSATSSTAVKTATPSTALVPGAQAKSVGMDADLWVEKYKPQQLSKICGQQGPKSNMNKLKNWLTSWWENNNGEKKKNYMQGKEDGSIFKAALLSGPPGVGKTTTATLVCQGVGFSFIEMNASDTRGKKALETVIKESLSNTTVMGALNASKMESRNHVLLMDEVDGMAGNEDRGGMQELIKLIKSSKIPIICMCNDRQHPKVRSLANHCFDLRFYRPQVQQIKGFALSVAAREGLKIPPPAIEQIIVGANQDIRQVLHNLQMWTSNSNTMTYDEAKANAKNAEKNIKLGPFDICKQLLSAADANKLNIHKKTELFFMDYSFIPLFLQENYLLTNPARAGGNKRKTLELMSQTADLIADSNLIERQIRGNQNWSLLPLQGYMSTVAPSDLMAGYLGGMIQFPKWLGKNSSQNKTDRILQELKTHMGLVTSANKSDINLGYLPVLKNSLMNPLLDASREPNDCAKEVIETMDAYNLTREDWDSIMEVTKWEHQSTPQVPTKVKSAFTRMYNKLDHKSPFATDKMTSKAKKTPKTDVNEHVLKEDGDGDDAEEEEEEEEDDTEAIMKKMMKKPSKAKAPAAKKPAAKKPAASKAATGKGKSKPKK